MNKVLMMGRLTKDPEIRYGGANNTAIAAFSLAVDRRYKKEGQPTADFFSCTAFGKTAEFMEKYLRKGSKIVIEGELQNDHYKDKNGVTQYTERIIVNTVEFAESKKASESNNTGSRSDENLSESGPNNSDDNFYDVPNSVEESLPFD